MSGTLLALLLLTPSAATAATVCYDTAPYPSVGRLVRTETGELAVPLPNQTAAVYSETRGWERIDFSCKDSKACGGKEGGDGFPGPAITLSGAEAIQLIPELATYWVTEYGDRTPAKVEQDIGAWTEHGGAVWFGISFYSGEGETGVGGVGRFDPKSQEMVIRRPSLIRDSSIDRIVHDGQWLWLSTAGNYECMGNLTPHGLVRYDWEADRLESFEARDDKPCGFTVHDLLVDATYLWVATDLGLSRRDRGTGNWEHFVPEPGAGTPMRPTTCEALYTRLLETLPMEEDEETLISYHSQLFESLAKFRPRFLAEYVRTMPPDKWRRDEFLYLGRNATDLRSLNETVFKFRPFGGGDVGFALWEFEEKRPREPMWADLLQTLLAPPKQQSDILYLLEHYASDTEIGDVLERRLSTAYSPSQDADVMSSWIREMSVPKLFAALDRGRHDEGKVRKIESIVLALMAATRTAIGPDGKETKLLPGASPDDCIFGCPPTGEAVLQVADHWSAWWRVHKQEFEGRDAPDGQGSAPERGPKG